MTPQIVLVIVTLVARPAGQLGAASLRNSAAAMRVGLAVMFCFTALAHFNSMRADLVRMVPPAIPNPELMVTFTGLCEILGAIGLLVPRTRRMAAIALIVSRCRARRKYPRGGVERHAPGRGGDPVDS